MAAVESQRLLLRPLCSEDAPFVVALLNDPAFLTFVGDKGVRTVEDARAYIADDGRKDGYTRRAFCLVVRKADQERIGLCSLVKRVALDHVDLGFAVLAQFRRQRYASEAAASMVGYARDVLGLQHVVAIATPDNAGSIGVLEAVGFRFVRMVRLTPSAQELRLFEWTDEAFSG